MACDSTLMELPIAQLVYQMLEPHLHLPVFSVEATWQAHSSAMLQLPRSSGYSSPRTSIFLPLVRANSGAKSQEVRCARDQFV